jgi:Family of unknown function (DUF6526)
MAEKMPQTLANHTRLDPLYHFFALPVFAFAVIWSVAHFIRHPGLHTAGLFLLLTAAAIAVFKLRTYATRLQDRIIRLEERVRLSALLSEPLRSRIPELTEGQLVALRFASDGECAGLVESALDGRTKPADLKKAIQNWRPDYWRV